jgi:hypothetical protein
MLSTLAQERYARSAPSVTTTTEKAPKCLAGALGNGTTSVPGKTVCATMTKGPP